MSLLRIQDALELVMTSVSPVEGETIAISNAMGRILVTDITSRLTHPPFNASSMDGYAVKSADLKSLPMDLSLVGEAAAGHGYAGEVKIGQSVRIFTGAPLPDGTDTVIAQEDTKSDGSNVRIEPGADTRLGNYVRPKGMDFSAGEKLLLKGRFLTARDLTLAAAMGHGKVVVRKRPLVAVLATGNELVEPGEIPGTDQIISSIPMGLAGLITKAGGQAHLLGIAPDNLTTLKEKLEGAQGVHVFVTIGGASVGKHDLVQFALKSQGIALDFWKVAMRPGKPLMFGRLRNMRVLGLPGNPVSALICARVFLVPLIRGLLDQHMPLNEYRPGILDSFVQSNGPRQHYMRAETVNIDPEGRPIVRAFDSQDSSLMSLLAQADSLIVRPPYAPEAQPGTSVDILPLDF